MPLEVIIPRITFSGLIHAFLRQDWEGGEGSELNFSTRPLVLRCYPL